MNERKNEIRAAMKARRKAVTPEARKAASEELSNRLFVENRELGAAISKKGPIAVYLASKEEIDLTDFIAAALSFGCAVVAPRWNGTEYELVRIDNLETLVKGPHGILEPPAGPVVQPNDVRAWLVPGLAFTKKGGRLGYGGGWYDRLLCKVPKRVPKIGVAYAFQLVDELPTEPHDIRLTSVESCEDLADVKPLIVPPEESERKQSFWTLKLGPDSRVADAANAQLEARPCTWGVGLWPSAEVETIAKRCAEILNEAFQCKAANFIPTDTMGGIHRLDYYGDIDDVEALIEIEREFQCDIPADKLQPELTFAEFVELVRSGRGKTILPKKSQLIGGWIGRCLGIGLVVLFVLAALLAPFYLFYDSYRRWAVAPPGGWSSCGAMVEFAIAGLIAYGVAKVLFDHCRNGSQRKRQRHWSVVNHK